MFAEVGGRNLGRLMDDELVHKSGGGRICTRKSQIFRSNSDLVRSQGDSLNVRAPKIYERRKLHPQVDLCPDTLEECAAL